eukprot:1183121-Prorocentrum_minimum.AAC.2
MAGRGAGLAKVRASDRVAGVSKALGRSVPGAAGLHNCHPTWAQGSGGVTQISRSTRAGVSPGGRGPPPESIRPLRLLECHSRQGGHGDQGLAGVP